MASEEDKWEFTPEYDGTIPLETAVYQAIGAASMAWVEIPRGEFDSNRAKVIADVLIQYLVKRKKYCAEA